MAGAGTVVSALLLSMSTIAKDGTEVWTGLYELSGDQKEIKMQIQERSAVNDAMEQLLLLWSASSGLLIRGNETNYKLVTQGDNIKRPKLVAESANQPELEYAYNERTAIAKRTKEDGTRIELHYIKTPGQLYNKVRKAVTVFPGRNGANARITEVINQFDNEGRLIRIIRDGKLAERFEYTLSAQNEHIVKRYSTGKPGDELVLASTKYYSQDRLTLLKEEVGNQVFHYSKDGSVGRVTEGANVIFDIANHSDAALIGLPQKN